MPPSTETIGFIGLGTMGRPMAANLARSAFEAIGFDADPDAAEAFRRGDRLPDRAGAGCDGSPIPRPSS